MSDSTYSLPHRVIVSLKAGGVFFAVANVVCVALIVYGYISVRRQPKTIEVKGSAKKEIVSDLVAWSCTITARDADLVRAYDKLNADAEKVRAFLKAAGIPEQEAKFSAISTQKIFVREVVSGGKARPLGAEAPADSGASGGGGTVIVQTNKVELYVLTQSISVESRDMNKVLEVARNITKLIKDGLEIESNPPSYLYTQLSALKIDMLAEATKDATKRAEQVVGNARGKLGRLVDAKMGVMQINPKNVSAVSDTGNNDTTSLEKEIMAIVTAKFEVE